MDWIDAGLAVRAPFGGQRVKKERDESTRRFDGPTAQHKLLDTSERCQPKSRDEASFRTATPWLRHV